MSSESRIAFYFCLMAGICSWAQSASVGNDPDEFYSVQAKSDGIYEQKLVFQSESDEWDYWKDQRNYERQLYLKNKISHAAYIRAKREVYATHKALCREQCEHGNYYFIQEAYYLQYSGGDPGDLTFQDSPTKPVGSAERNRH